MSVLHLEGGLQRQVGVLKSWKRYQCELTDDVLTCRSVSKSNKGSLKKDAIDLSQAHSVRKLNAQQLAFQIVAKSGKTFTFAADSQELLSKWISALQMAMQVKRRSQMSSLSEFRDTQYSEPWDLKQPILPMFFNQNSRYSSSSGHYATAHHGADQSESDYATAHHGADQSENDYATAHHGADQSESDYATADDLGLVNQSGCAYDSTDHLRLDQTGSAYDYTTDQLECAYATTVDFKPEAMESACATNCHSTEQEVFDDDCEEAGYAEVRVVNRTHMDIKQPQFHYQEDSSPLILRRSKYSSTSYDSSDQSNEHSSSCQATTPDDVTTDMNNLSEEDVEKLLLDLKSMINRSSSYSIPQVEYSPAVMELADLIESNDDGYQFVNRRASLKGTYIDKLRAMLDDPKKEPGMVRFQMDF